MQEDLQENILTTSAPTCSLFQGRRQESIPGMLKLTAASQVNRSATVVISWLVWFIQG